MVHVTSCPIMLLDERVVRMRGFIVDVRVTMVEVMSDIAVCQVVSVMMAAVRTLVTFGREIHELVHRISIMELGCELVSHKY